MANKARNTRPPSMGKAGMRLKENSMTLVVKRLYTMLSLLTGLHQSEKAGTCPLKAKKMRKPMASTKLTAGPAKAMSISCQGFSGICSIAATPPIGKRVMWLVFTPNLFPIKA